MPWQWQHLILYAAPCLATYISEAGRDLRDSQQQSYSRDQNDHVQPIYIERFSYDLEKWFRYSVRYLFHQPISEKIKTRTLRFPAKENPNMVKALFDWPIVLQYDVKAKYRLISRKFLGMTFFYPSVRLTNRKPRTFVSVR